MNEIDRKIEVHVKSKYGLGAKKYASGTNFETGMREVCFDIFNEDGSRFIVDGLHNEYTGEITTKERPYIEY